ncbi:MAG: ATP-dependent metallopeptidase FtsH/Yme1/Tma family protein, partial [Deltaproteobacteria bacterium]|nr:ATP-dependent metallopeptidase FtsH/Yme1/Tma family protein [Deltaproteobacteria bacterium]
MKQTSKNLALWLVLGLMFLLLFSVFTRQHNREPEIVFSEFWAAVEKGDVLEVTIQGQNVEGKFQNGESFTTYVPYDPDLVKTLQAKEVRITAKPG